LWTAFIGLVVAAACSRGPKPAAGPVSYSPPGGGFTASLPPAWRVDETRGEDRLASFFGPGAGTEAETVFVYYFPSTSRWKNAREYAYAQATTGRAGPVTESASRCEVTVVRTRDDAHLGRRDQKVRTVTTAAPGGFFALEDVTDPARESPTADFDAFVASFKAAPAVK
jgi:hypothetical protein